MLKADAFKNYGSLELSFAEFSRRRTKGFPAPLRLRSVPLLMPLKLSEAEFSEYHQPNNACFYVLIRPFYCRAKYSERTQNFGDYG